MNTPFEILVYTWAYIILGLYCKEAVDHIHNNDEPSDESDTIWAVIATFLAPPFLACILITWLWNTSVTLTKRLLHIKTK